MTDPSTAISEAYDRGRQDEADQWNPMLGRVISRAQDQGYLMLSEVLEEIRDGAVRRPRPVARRWLQHEAFRDALNLAAVLAGWQARPDASKLTTEQCDAICVAAVGAVVDRLLRWADE